MAATPTVHIRLPIDLLTWLRARAKDEGRTASQMIARVLELTRRSEATTKKHRRR